MRGNAAARQRAEAVVSRVPENGWVAEIGTMTGNMAIEAKRMRPDIVWFMVDSWLPISEQPERYKETRDDNALKSVQTTLNHKATAYQRAAQLGISVINLSSVAAAFLFQDELLSAVFIDADHSYGGVKEDIEAWKPKVAVGGWLGGHDYKNIDPRFKGVDRAVEEAFPEGVEKDKNYTWWKQIYPLRMT